MRSRYSLAYATLAGLPPHYGIYCYLVGGLAYASFGTSKQLAIGPMSAISIRKLLGVPGAAGGPAGALRGPGERGAAGSAGWQEAFRVSPLRHLHATIDAITTISAIGRAGAADTPRWPARTAMAADPRIAPPLHCIGRGGSREGSGQSVADSEKSEDVLITGIATCRECHGDPGRGIGFSQPASPATAYISRRGPRWMVGAAPTGRPSPLVRRRCRRRISRLPRSARTPSKGAPL